MLKQRNGRPLIIIGPHPDQIVQKFPEEVRGKIIALPIKFGSKYFQKQIHDFAANVRTLRIKVKTSSPSIGFKSSIQIKSGAITKIDGTQTMKTMASSASGTWIEIDNLPSIEKEMEVDRP